MLFLPYTRSIAENEIAAIERYVDRALLLGLEPEHIVHDVEIRHPAVRLFLHGEGDDVIVAVLEDASPDAGPSPTPLPPSALPGRSP